MQEFHPLTEFHPRDLDGVHQLVTKTIDRSYPPFYPPRALEFFRHYHQKESILRDAREGYTVVLIEEEKYIATGTLFGTNIRRVFIDPDHQRRGFGSLVMRALEKKAVEQGLKFVDLDSSLFAKNFYLGQNYLNLKDARIELPQGDILAYSKMGKPFVPVNDGRWDFDGRSFSVEWKNPNGAGMPEGSVFDFIQRTNLVYGVRRAGDGIFGEFVGVVQGDCVHFSVVIEFHGGAVDHAQGSGTIAEPEGGRVQIVGTIGGSGDGKETVVLCSR